MEQNNSTVQTTTTTTTKVVNRQPKISLKIVKATFGVLLMNFAVAGMQLRLEEATFNFNEYTIAGIVFLILASCFGGIMFVVIECDRGMISRLYRIGLMTFMIGQVLISFSFNNLFYGITVSLLSVFMSMMFDFIYYICTIDSPFKNKSENKGEIKDAN